MDLSSDLKEHFDRLQQTFSCPKCKRLFNSSILLTTCQHIQCEKCWNPKEHSCNTCKNPYNEVDIKHDDFLIGSILKSINNIQNIFEGSNVSSNSDNAETSVITTSKSGVSDTVKYEIMVPKLAMRRNHKGETPLHMACRKGDLNQVRQLFKEGVDFNMTDFADWAPIHEAIVGGHKDCVEYLLTNGALTNIPGENYTTPLHKAISSNQMSIAQVLISYGANLNALNYLGKKPLDLIKTHSLSIKRDYEITSQVFVGIETIVYTKQLTKSSRFNLTKAKVKFATKSEFLTKDYVTHYICTDNSDREDFDILICLLKGIFIVGTDWITDYSNNLEKKSFESIVKTYKKTNELSIMNHLFKNPKLFDGMSFYIPNFIKSKQIMHFRLTKENLLNLIQAGGGKLLSRTPIVPESQKWLFCYPFHAADTSLAACDNYIIYHESNEPELRYNMKDLKHKSSKWLIQCILNFKIIDE